MSFGFAPRAQLAIQAFDRVRLRGASFGGGEPFVEQLWFTEPQLRVPVSIGPESDNRRVAELRRSKRWARPFNAVDQCSVHVQLGEPDILFGAHSRIPVVARNDDGRAFRVRKHRAIESFAQEMQREWFPVLETQMPEIFLPRDVLHLVRCPQN